jgi:lipopolysaccharide export system protein LptC
VRLSATRLFPLLLMLALALLSFWLEQALRVEEVPPALRRHDPDYLVDHFTLVKYNAAGAKEASLVAAKMVHYPDDDSTELLAPRIVQTKADEPRLTASADRGTLSQDGDEVFLYGNVVLERDGGAGRPAARMRTSFLHVVTPRSLVRTDREVTVQEDDRTLSARGMEYRNDTGQLTLRAQVRGRFAPAPAAPGAR